MYRPSGYICPIPEQYWIMCPFFNHRIHIIFHNIVNKMWKIAMTGQIFDLCFMVFSSIKNYSFEGRLYKYWWSKMLRKENYKLSLFCFKHVHFDLHICNCTYTVNYHFRASKGHCIQSLFQSFQIHVVN